MAQNANDTKKKPTDWVHINGFSPNELCLLVPDSLPTKLPLRLEISNPRLTREFKNTIEYHACKFALSKNLGPNVKTRLIEEEGKLKFVEVYE